MIRVLAFFAFVALAAVGLAFVGDHPGTVLITLAGTEYQFSTLVGLVALLAFAVVVLIAWSLLRFVFKLPSLMSMLGRNKRRDKGLAALSKGMMAVGAGDVAAARKQADKAGRLLGQEPMTLLLKAQAAQLAGDRALAQGVFTQMLDHADTRLLGLRGLHMEAQRRGDGEAAYRFASEAQAIAALPWAGQAVLQHRAAQNDWAGALAAVERNAAGRLIDRPTANRQKAALQTAVALDTEERKPDEALILAREALRLAPTLVPAATLAGKLLGRRGELRRAAKLIEAAFVATPHPDLAAVYVNLRIGDSATDRLARAEALARLAPGQPESRLTVARAATDAREFNRARQIMAPLINGEEGSRPTARTCLMMADIEEAQHGEGGALLEWLQRAARAPHDPAWIADGMISDRWAPVSPVSGQIDAFKWEAPNERLSSPERLRVAPPRVRDDGDGNDRPALTVEQADEAPVEADMPVVATSLAPTPAANPEGSRRTATAEPVVFPLAAAPDDPGLPSGPARTRGRDRLDFTNSAG